MLRGTAAVGGSSLNLGTNLLFEPTDAFLEELIKVGRHNRNELEPFKQRHAIIVGFGTNDQALIEVALGLYEPKGRLPIQFPINMDTVEAQFEDVAKDMTPYTDSQGNAYDYGFGLNYSGVIAD